MSEIAKSSGVAREVLYKALKPDTQPRFETIARVCKALDVRLVAQTVEFSSLGKLSAASCCKASYRYPREDHRRVIKHA